jgi:hypothetical protein
MIENEYGGHGTGFLVFRPSEAGSKEGKVFLVSNKHVLNNDLELRNKAKKVNLHLNIRKEDQSIVAHDAEISFKTLNNENIPAKSRLVRIWILIPDYQTNKKL